MIINTSETSNIVIDDAFVEKKMENGSRKAVFRVRNYGKDEVRISIFCNEKVANVLVNVEKASRKRTLNESYIAIPGSGVFDLNPRFNYPWGKFSNPGYMTITDDGAGKEIYCNFSVGKGISILVHFNTIESLDSLNRF